MVSACWPENDQVIESTLRVIRRPEWAGSDGGDGVWVGIGAAGEAPAAAPWAGGCSLISQPTARSSPARALPSSASTWAIWSCDLEDLAQRRQHRRVIDVALGIVASGQLHRFAGAGQDAVPEQGEDVLLDLGLHHQVLNLAEGLVPLGFVELGVGDGAFLGLADAGLILLSGGPAG